MLDEAVAAFTRALSIDARMATAERNLHIAWRDTGLFDSEISALEQRLAHDRWIGTRDASWPVLLAGEAARAIPHFERLSPDRTPHTR